MFPYSREHSGRFLGLSANVRDILIYRVSTACNTILSQSVMQSAPNKININLRAFNICNEGVLNVSCNFKIEYHIKMKREFLKIT